MGEDRNFEIYNNEDVEDSALRCKNYIEKLIFWMFNEVMKWWTDRYTKIHAEEQHMDAYWNDSVCCHLCKYTHQQSFHMLGYASVLFLRAGACEKEKQESKTSWGSVCQDQKICWPVWCLKHYLCETCFQLLTVLQTSFYIYSFNKTAQFLL